MAHEFSRADEAARFIQLHTRLRPQIAVVLGSGLGALAGELASPERVDYRDIPHFPHSTAVGHAGRLVLGELAGVPLACMQGRVHLYEGYPPRDVVFPVRVLKRMGVRALVLTNAAGGINLAYPEGCLVVLNDHINLQGASPLAGPEDERLGPRFFAMTEAYSQAYRELALAAGRKLGLPIYEGVYAALPGPQYETPAEIRYLRAIGADLVGMSTVPETIAARQMEMRVLAISCVTNCYGENGRSTAKLTHEEVLEVGQRVAGQFIALLKAVVPEMAQRL